MSLAKKLVGKKWNDCYNLGHLGLMNCISLCFAVLIDSIFLEFSRILDFIPSEWLYLRILDRLDSGKYRIIDWLLIDYGQFGG